MMRLTAAGTAAARRHHPAGRSPALPPPSQQPLVRAGWQGTAIKSRTVAWKRRRRVHFEAARGMGGPPEDGDGDGDGRADRRASPPLASEQLDMYTLRSEGPGIGQQRTAVEQSTGFCYVTFCRIWLTFQKLLR